MKPIPRAYWYLLASILALAIFYLGNDFAFRKFPEISVLNIVFWAWLGCNIIISPFFLSTKTSRKKLKNEFSQHWKLLIGTSFITAIGGFIWYFCISESSSGIISLLEKVNIFITFLLGVFLLHEKISRKEVFFMIITLCGLFFIASLEGEIAPLIVFLLLISRLCYAFQSFFIKKYGEGIDAFFFAYIRCHLMFAFLGSVALLTGEIVLIPFDLFLGVSLIQILGVFVSRGFFFKAHKDLSISKLNFFMLGESIFVLLGTYFIFGDSINLQKFGGAILIFLGLLLFLREQVSKK